MKVHRILGCAAALSLFAAAGDAADPASGTIDDQNHSTTWSGMLLTPNPGGSLVPVVCEEGTPTCDVYRFEVKLGAVSPDTDLLTVSVEWSDPSGGQTDVDLYVYNEDTGQQVGSGTASGGGYDAAIFPAANGRYRVDVIPWASAAQAYTGTVRFESFKRKDGVFGSAGALAVAPLALLVLAAFARRRRRA